MGIRFHTLGYKGILSLGDNFGNSSLRNLWALSWPSRDKALTEDKLWFGYVPCNIRSKSVCKALLRQLSRGLSKFLRNIFIFHYTYRQTMTWGALKWLHHMKFPKFLVNMWVAQLLEVTKSPSGCQISIKINYCFSGLCTLH